MTVTTDTNKPAGAEKSNTFKGTGALASITTGEANSAFGDHALNACTSSSNNAGYGAYALANLNEGGGGNTGVGEGALLESTEGSDNTAVGNFAGRSNVTGTGNTYVGKSAGYNHTGKNCTIIGYKAGEALAAGANAKLVIGYEGQTLVGGDFSKGELQLGEAGTKIGFAAAAPVAIKAPGAETTKALWERLKELGLAL